MGIYACSGMSSAERVRWLEDHAVRPPGIGGRPVEWGDRPEGTLPVCAVLNATFIALAIAYDASEQAEFSRLDDTRLKRWGYVRVEELREVSPLDAHLDGVL